MAFAICPDDGLPRLWRFVAPGVLPPEVIATLDSKKNLLVIDKEMFEKLDFFERHMLLRTHAAVTYGTYDRARVA